MFDYDNSYTVKPLKITDRAIFLVVFMLLLPYYQMLGKPLIMTAKTSTHALDIQCFVHSREVTTQSYYDPLVIVFFSYRVNLKVEI